MIKQELDYMFLVGDLHYGVHVNSLKWFEIQKEYIHKVLIPTVKFYKDQGKKITIWQMGDIFEQKLSLNVNILNQVIELMRELLKYCDVNVVLGNHDVYYIDNSDVNSPSILANTFENFNIVTKPTELLVNGKFKFLVLPWMKDVDKLHEEVAKSDADYMLTHLDINGFKYPSGISVRDHIDPSALQKYAKVYSGHIHLRQTEGNVLYTGTPYQTEYSDINNEKGIYMLQFEDKNITEHFLPNTVSPEYYEIGFNDLLEMPLNEAKEKLNNKFLYVKIPFSKMEKINIKDFSTYIKDNIPNIRLLKINEYSEVKALNDNGEELIEPITTLNIFDIAKDILIDAGINNTLMEDVIQDLNKLHENAKKELRDGEEGG